MPCERQLCNKKAPEKDSKRLKNNMQMHASRETDAHKLQSVLTEIRSPVKES